MATLPTAQTGSYVKCYFKPKKGKTNGKKHRKQLRGTPPLRIYFTHQFFLTDVFSSVFLLGTESQTLHGMEQFFPQTGHFLTLISC